MSKELEATDKNIITKQVVINTPTSARLLPITADEKVIDEIQQALNELEDAKHNYNSMVQMYNNAAAYAIKIQAELNELKRSGQTKEAPKRNEPMKPNYGGKFPQCPVCKKLLHSIWQKHCDNCAQAIDWSDEK